MDMGHDKARQLQQTCKLFIKHFSRLVDSHTDAVERTFRNTQSADFHEVVKDGPVRSSAMLFLPVIETGDERLQISVDLAQPRESFDEQNDEAAIREEVVDEWEDVEGEVNRKLPRVFERHRLLVAERVITHCKARNISLVKRFHQLFVKPRLFKQVVTIVRQNRVDDQCVVKRDQVAAGTVKRIGEAAGLARHGPARGADRLPAVVRKVFEGAVAEDLSKRQIAREERKLRADPIDKLWQRSNALTLNEPVVVDQAERGFALQWDHPEPEAFTAEVIRG